MANATLEDVIEKQWNKIATGVITGKLVRPLDMGKYAYYFTYRDTTDTPPSNADLTDGNLRERLFENGNNENPIKATTPIDIYVTAEDADTGTTSTAKIKVAAS